jgi:DNA-binding IclR family transcriptional regulator
MPKIKIIQATPGLKTTERLLILLQNYPEGITMRKLSQQLNRPVSMLNICLKTLISIE